MRDYGVVRVRFWEWAKRRGLDAEERELALYLLTSPHGNALGCFRLPVAYLCDDLGKDAARAARTLRKLCEIGFLARDEATGWTWIRGKSVAEPVSFITVCLRARDAPDDDAPHTVEEIIAMGERESWWDGVH